MDKPFKFRYASQMAGAFVILGVALFVTGIILAGRSKGWFEGTFQLVAFFDTVEGSFGLKEGSEITIRGAPAGRVTRVAPTPDGRIEARLKVKERFHRFLSRSSEGLVKKKFVAAGDSYVELVTAEGEPIQDGDTIVCRKDQELMDTAEKALEEVQKVVLPMLAEVETLLKHVNTIAGTVAEGKGVAGTMISDEELAAEVKTATKRVNDLLDESYSTLHETKRVIQGVQRHWLLRKYVPKEEPPGWLTAAELGSDKRIRAAKDWRERLNQARVADDREDVLMYANALASLLIVDGAYDEALALLKEAQAAAATGGESQVPMLLVEAEILRREDRTPEALALLAALEGDLGDVDRDLRAEAYLMRGWIYASSGRPKPAREALEASKRDVRKSDSPVLKARAARVRGLILSEESDAVAAAAAFDNEAEHLRKAGLYRGMAGALAAAGSAYEAADDKMAAADRLFRAGRSLYAAGDREAALALLQRARPLAEASDQQYIVDCIGGMVKSDSDDT